MTGGFLLLGRFEPLDLSFNHQFLISAELHAVFLGEALGAFGHKINVRALVEYQARRLNWISNPLHAADTARAHGCAVHHERVQLHPPITSKSTAAAGVKGFVILHSNDSG